MTTDEVRELIIIGSGPAGYTAAVYAARAQLRPLVFEGTQFGGALMTTTEVENYPGFTDGILGPELMEQMRNQAIRFGAELRTEDVEEVSLAGPVKTVTAHGVTYRARAVILAMGAAARYLNVPGEQKLLGHGVSACATCDGFFFRDQDIAVVGGGDSAMEEATFLTRFARSVTVVHRRDDFRASKIMIERAQERPQDALADERRGHRGASATARSRGLRLRDTKTGEESTLDVTGMFVAIGHDPRSELVRGQVGTDEAGYVLTDAPGTRTSIPGVFACGDLVDHTYRQADHGRRLRLRRGDRRRALARRGPGRARARRRRLRRRRGRGRGRRPLIPSPFRPNRRSRMSKNTVDVTDATFSTDVLQSDKTVLVDFWAEWCGPCKMVAPVLDEIAGENKDTLTVAKLDIDRNPDAMRKYKIMAVPTLMVFQKGEVVKEIRGAKPKAALLRDLADYLG